MKDIWSILTGKKYLICEDEDRPKVANLLQYLCGLIAGDGYYVHLEAVNRNTFEELINLELDGDSTEARTETQA